MLKALIGALALVCATFTLAQAGPSLQVPDQVVCPEYQQSGCGVTITLTPLYETPPEDCECASCKKVKITFTIKCGSNGTCTRTSTVCSESTEAVSAMCGGHTFTASPQTAATWGSIQQQGLCTQIVHT